MAPLITAPAQYAVRALVHLARRPAAETTRVKDVAAAEDIPYPFLAKLIPDLVSAGLIESFKGPTGGIRLSRAPHQIRALEVIRAVQDEAALDHCLIGLPECHDDTPCPVHEFWKPTRARIVRTLGEVTLTELAESLRLKLERLEGLEQPEPP